MSSGVPSASCLFWDIANMIPNLEKIEKKLDWQWVQSYPIKKQIMEKNRFHSVLEDVDTYLQTTGKIIASHYLNDTMLVEKQREAQKKVNEIFQRHYRRRINS